MQDLLAGIDDSFFNSVPSPDQPRKRAPSKTRVHLSPVRCAFKTPEKQRHGRVATPKNARSPGQAKENVGTEDLAALVEGAEGWDWEDMHADFLTPKKATPRKPKVRRLDCLACIADSDLSKQDVQKNIQKLVVETVPGEPQWTPDPCVRCTVKEVVRGGHLHKVRKRPTTTR